MAKKNWNITLDNEEYSVKLEHGYLSGKRKILVNGNSINLGSDVKPSGIDIGSRHVFRLGNHECMVEILTNGIKFEYDLYVDGISLSTGKELDMKSRTDTIDKEKYDKSVQITFSGLLLIFGLGAIGTNVWLVSWKGIYFPAVSYFGAMALVFSGYMALFKKKDGSTREIQITEGIIALVVCLVLGMIVNILISGNIY